MDSPCRWRSSDNGLIWCWERGCLMAKENPELSKKAKKGELMTLGWKGGVPKGFKGKKKEGTFNYLAQWQGLAGKDLDIETDTALTITCSLSGVNVNFSKDGWKE